MRRSRREFVQSVIDATAGSALGLILGKGAAQAAETTRPAGTWSMEEHALPAVAVTKGPRQHFFGYYDKRQFDFTGRYLLGLECDVAGRLQEPDDVATLGILDLQEEYRWTPFAETRAWNWQMGCHAEWLPGEDPAIIYNDRRDTGLVAVLHRKSGGQRVLSRAIFTLSPDGRSALSLNFARLWRVRPETGYCGVEDPWPNDPAPAGDGLFLIDLATGESRLAISHADMEPFRAGAPADGLFYFTHPAFNEDGSRLLFWYRHARGEGRWESGVFTADPDGSNLHLLARGNSHTVWFDREHVLVWLSRGPQGPHFYLFKDRTSEYQVAGGDVLVENGHALYSPDGKWLLSDLPVNGRNERTLVVANLREQRCHILGRFFAPPEMKDALRCDLHARWNQSGTVICFDSLHEGSRQMYLVDLRPLVEGRPRRQTRSSTDLSG